MIPWLIIGIFILIIVLLIYAIIVNKGKKQKTDYYAFFITGIIWIPFGLIMFIQDRTSSLGTIFVVLGVIYAGIGLAHKKEWKKNHVPFNKLQSKKKKLIIIATLLLGILVFLTGLIVYFQKV